LLVTVTNSTPRHSQILLLLQLCELLLLSRLLEAKLLLLLLHLLGLEGGELLRHFQLLLRVLLGRGLGRLPLNAWRS